MLTLICANAPVVNKFVAEAQGPAGSTALSTVQTPLLNAPLKESAPSRVKEVI
jgi:hypothetical protein